jgi:hypothetical protein
MSSRCRSWSTRFLAAFALFAGLAACGSGPGTFAQSHAPSGPSTVFVAIGGDESAGPSVSDPDRQDWVQLFYRDALSARSTLYDFSATGGSTAEDLVGGETTQILALHPGVVTVWVGLDDLFGGTPASVERQEMTDVLGALRKKGAKVLVANLLPLYRFPAYPRCFEQPLSCGLPDPPFSLAPGAAPFTDYDQAISGAAGSVGATLVNVAAAFGSSLRAGSGALVDQSDLGLTPAGEALVAKTFARALDASGP